MKFVRLCHALHDPGLLIPEGDLGKYTQDDKEAYVSVYKYNEGHFNDFQYTRSIVGMKDVTTDTLVFDFDNKPDPSLAQKEAIALIERLRKAGINESDVGCYFSGSKGFNVVLRFHREFTPTQTGALALKIAEGINIDRSLYDHSQTLRVPHTRHPKSGLHKIPLTLEQINKLTIDEIKLLAQDRKTNSHLTWTMATPPEEFFMLPPEEKKELPAYELDLSKKAPGWKNCKWSLLQGNFNSGERHNAILVIAATCRALNYDRNTTYFMCKSASEKQAQLHKQDKFSKKEIWNDIIQSVFSDRWEGGQYSCKAHPWLSVYCKNLGKFACKHEEITQASVSVDEMASNFEKYASEFEKNVIKTGLRELDENVMFCAASLNGILGQPGSGKTAISLSYLKNTSLNNVDSMFFSLDMAMPMIFAKLIQKEKTCTFRKALEVYRTNPGARKEMNQVLGTQYARTGFNFNTGVTVGDMKRIVEERQERIGRPIKLVIIDYLECLAGPYQDPTANTGYIANQLKDLANELQTCVVLLLQTQKHSTPDISDPLLSMKCIKGASVIEQACSVVVTMWREGYNPRTVDHDKYISLAAVKNRLGSLWSGDFGWNGMRGEISELAEEERTALSEFRAYKKQMKVKEAELNAKGWGF